ncbi:hypothetical protein IFR04_000992 [Cadophora malorum]|uniref:Uncharacterized protein n=1 Tax=Cadophora malorum TaxID=108018 RepID=A0A8H7WJ51_9HELO|nr:hypothetical protein IFR04_000992 [Cadophora malorum]
MEPTIYSVEAVTEALFKDGFLVQKDSAVGDGIQEIEKKGFEFFSENGLDFCQQYVLNTRILSIVESFFGNETCILAHCLRYIAYPGHISCFRRGGPKAGRRALAVHLLAKGSRVGYYSGSHNHDLPTTKGIRFLNEISQSALDEVGCQCEEKAFPDGGLTIFDARIGFELKEGYAITFEFATADVIKTWPKIVLPSSPELIQKVGDMERDLETRRPQRVRTNFVFREPIASTNT